MTHYDNDGFFGGGTGSSGGADAALQDFTFDVTRADVIRDVAPTVAETSATPEENDRACVYLLDGAKEIWKYQGGSWGLIFTQEPDSSGTVLQWNAGVSITDTLGNTINPGNYYHSYPDGTSVLIPNAIFDIPVDWEIVTSGAATLVLDRPFTYYQASSVNDQTWTIASDLEGADRIVVEKSTAATLTIDFEDPVARFTIGDELSTTLTLQNFENVTLTRRAGGFWIVNSIYPVESQSEVVTQLSSFQRINAASVVQSGSLGGVATALLTDSGGATSHYRTNERLPLTSDQSVRLRVKRDSSALTSFMLRTAGAGTQELIVNLDTGAAFADNSGAGLDPVIESVTVTDDVIDVVATFQSNAGITQWDLFPAIGDNTIVDGTGFDAAVTGTLEVVQIDFNYSDVISSGVSADAGNLLTLGSDNLPFYAEITPVNNVVSEVSNGAGANTGVIETTFTPTVSRDYVFEYSGEVQQGTGGISVGTTPQATDLFVANPASGDADGSRLTLTRQDNFTPPISLTAGITYHITQWAGGGGIIFNHTVSSQEQPDVEGLASTKIDASAGAVTVLLDASTNNGVVRLFTNIDLTNTATLAVQSGETLNGVTNGAFLFSNYDAGAQFRADEVVGGWVVSVVGASGQKTLQKTRIYATTSQIIDATATVATGTGALITAAGGTPEISFDAIGINNGNGADVANNAINITQDGIYDLSAGIAMNDGTAATLVLIQIIKNGTELIAERFTRAEGTSNVARHSIAGIEDVELNENDVITVLAQRTGSNGDRPTYANTETDVFLHVSQKANTASVPARSLQVEDLRVVEFSETTGLGFGVNYQLDGGRTWTDLKNEYEYIDINFDVAVTAVPNRILRTVTIATKQLEEASRWRFEYGSAVVDMDTNLANGDFSFTGAVIDNITIEIVGVKAQRTVGGGIDTLDTTGFESVRDAVLGNYGRGTPTSGTSAPNGQQRSIPLQNITVGCLLYTSPSPRDLSTSRMPSSA